MSFFEIFGGQPDAGRQARLDKFRMQQTADDQAIDNLLLHANRQDTPALAILLQRIAASGPDAMTVAYHYLGKVVTAGALNHDLCPKCGGEPHDTPDEIIQS